MRLVIQRVTSATVTIHGQQTAAIGQGLLVLVGIEAADGDEDIDWLTGKLMRLRIFDDAAGVMNRSVMDMPDARILVVSQFTLMASTRKGNRPSYLKAAPPAIARPLYDRFIQRLSQQVGYPVPTGTFGADMQVALTNDGPVTILIDSHLRE